jgi:hypothetical protein
VRLEGGHSFEACKHNNTVTRATCQFCVRIRLRLIARGSECGRFWDAMLRVPVDGASRANRRSWYEFYGRRPRASRAAVCSISVTYLFVFAPSVVLPAQAKVATMAMQRREKQKW